MAVEGGKDDAEDEEVAGTVHNGMSSDRGRGGRASLEIHVVNEAPEICVS